MRAASEVEQEERRRKPWMKIEVRGGGGFLVLGGALIAAGVGAAFAAHRAHVYNKRSRSSMRPTDERCEVEESLNKGISFDGQLDEVNGEAATGVTCLMTPDPIPMTPSIKLAESWQGESSVHHTAEIQGSTSIPKVDQSPTFKNLEIVVATEDTAECGDNVVQEFSLGGPEYGMVQKRNEKIMEESELGNLNELREEMKEFSFGGVEFTKIQYKNKKILEESGLDRDNDEEEKDDGEEQEEDLSPKELEFSFRAVGSDTIRNQTKQTLEESKLSHDKEEKEEEEINNDMEAPSSESQEEETESSSAEEESERQDEGSDGTGASSKGSSFEAVWPAEQAIEQEESSLLEKHQEVTEESSKEEVTAAQAEEEIEEYGEEFTEEKRDVGEQLGNEMGTRPKMMKSESERGLMAVNYSNRLLLLLVLAIAVGPISFAHSDHLHHFHLAKLYQLAPVSRLLPFQQCHVNCIYGEFCSSAHAIFVFVSLLLFVPRGAYSTSD